MATISENDPYQHYTGMGIRQKLVLTAEQTVTIQTNYTTLKHVTVQAALTATPNPTITHAAGVLTIDFGAPVTDTIYVDAVGI